MATNFAPLEEDVSTAMPQGVEFPIEQDQGGFESLSRSETKEERLDRVKNVKLPSTLSEAEERTARDLLVRHAETFKKTPGLCTITEVAIDTGSHRPVASRGYRNPLVANESFLKQLEE